MLAESIIGCLINTILLRATIKEGIQINLSKHRPKKKQKGTSIFNIKRYKVGNAMKGTQQIE